MPTFRKLIFETSSDYSVNDLYCRTPLGMFSIKQLYCTTREKFTDVWAVSFGDSEIVRLSSREDAIEYANRWWFESLAKCNEVNITECSYRTY